MHTTVITDEDGQEWRFHHNGDMSGDAIVIAPVRLADPGVDNEATIPIDVMRQLLASGVEDEDEEGRRIEVTAKPMEGFGGGFRQEWISGEKDGVVVQLSSGAGFGNVFLTLMVAIDGEEVRWEVIDVRPLVETWAAAIEAEVRKEL